MFINLLSIFYAEKFYSGIFGGESNFPHISSAVLISAGFCRNQKYGRAGAEKGTGMERTSGQKF
jgi:hypothetical protein